MFKSSSAMAQQPQPPIKPTRFRFPFKQKTPLLPPPTSSSGSPSRISSSAGSPPNSGSGIFNLGRKLGFKPTTPTLRKSVSFSSGRSSPSKDNNMDWKKKISADHTDVAYREAVGRLRAILSPRPTIKSVTGSPIKDLTSPSKPSHPSPIFTPEKKEGTISSSLRSMFTKDANANNQVNLNNQQQTSVVPPGFVGSLPNRTLPYPHGYAPFYASDPANLQREDDLFGFIEKQSEYIAQLEKETKYSRNELATMLDKVKDVIAENEELHQKQKTDLLTNMIQHLNEKTDGYGSALAEMKQSKIKSNGGSSNVIIESKITELEAQLSQARRNLRLAQEEILDMRKGNIGGTSGSSTMNGNKEVSPAGLSNNLYANCDLHRTEIDTLVREKSDLLDTMQKMKQMVGDLRDRESDAAKKVKNSLEIVEQMQVEKAQSDMETRRLKEELDRHQQRIRDMIQDHSRRLHDEKLQVEKKYKQELDQLNNEMNIELDCLTKARLDLERQKRLETDLRRELQQKMCTIEDIRQEMQIKISHMQAELGNSITQKSTIEQELINIRLNAEKADRDSRQDAARLQAEINGLRKRLEQSDMELVKSQELIMKLNETISHLQRENSLAKIRLESHIAENPELADADVVTIIQNMEDKHNRDMQDLEQLIQQQNGLLDKLRGECKTLTDKLEETGRQYKFSSFSQNRADY
ncbi:serologically defined colon cancer antigen 8 homolog isoform X3 [Folsomia candida]|uniref:serologically defined colon cancer antigen 8 homolog isoform X3 n=1 Tax=Folsomia candida TaxID=158441 RepID=UPI001605505C|nr:serologically defined colon cancer antigen 8 homolog isoform X3 [Folsomia candida]